MLEPSLKIQVATLLKQGGNYSKLNSCIFPAYFKKREPIRPLIIHLISNTKKAGRSLLFLCNQSRD